VSGTGRRRKPNPNEEGYAPDAQPAAGPAPTVPPQPEYSYDWRRSAQPPPPPLPPSLPPTAPPADQRDGPGPVFDAFSTARAEPAGLFDDIDLFGDGPGERAGPVFGAPPPPPVTPRPVPDRPAAAGPAETDGRGERGEQKVRDGYTAADFAFLEEETGNDVEHWLDFVETRANSRAERLRLFRRRIIVLAVLVGLVAAGFGAYVALAGNPLTPAPTATQSVIMFQLRDPVGDAVGDALLVADDTAVNGGVTGHGAAVLIPSQLVVNTIAFGSQPFGGEMGNSTPIPPAGADTVSDVLGVNIAGVWGMDETTFAALVDEMDGLPVTTTVAVPAGASRPAVALGKETLTGAQAVAYAAYTVKGESAEAQTDRFGQVVAAMLAVLPTNPVVVTGYLNHLGIVNDPTLPESRLSPILGALAAEQQAGKFTVQPLPMRTDGSEELDYQAASPVVANLLGGVLKSGSAAGQLPRVLVEDGSGATGQASTILRSAAEAKLANAGYTEADGATAAARSTTVVEIASSDEQSAAQQVAQTLGLPSSDVRVVPNLSTVADVTVVLGADWPKLAGVPLTGTSQSAG
jgi:hypothetical protein